MMQDSLTGDIITDHRAIARRYLKGWFAIDVLATFPVDYIVRGVEVCCWLSRLKTLLHTDVHREKDVLPHYG
jgi:hypothetical protein